MNRNKKSSPFNNCKSVLLLCTITFSLCACADDEWTKAITGEPDSSVLNAPRVVGVPPSMNKDNWPNLADVPDRPTDFTPPAKWDKLSKKMKKDRKKAIAAKRRIDAEVEAAEESIENSAITESTENTGE